MEIQNRTLRTPFNEVRDQLKRTPFNGYQETKITIDTIFTAIVVPEEEII